MDKRRQHPFIILLCVPLMMMLLTGSMLWYTTWSIRNTNVHRIDALIKQYPEEEEQIIRIFGEKTNDAEDSADSAGESLLKKYGKNGIFQQEKRLLFLCGGGCAVLILINAVTVLVVYRRVRKEESTLEKQWEENREALLDLQMRYEKMKEYTEREEQDTKSLITDISHQLKTPIASMKLSRELLLSTELTEEELIEFRQKETEELNKLELLLQSLMNLSKLEAKLIQIQPVVANFKDTMLHAVSSIYMRASDKKIQISMESFPDICLEHDPKWTEEVFVNVLDNAVKYSPEYSQILIQGQELVSCVLVEISDQGIGISPDESHRIFQRFYRGKNADKSSKEGSGVGLYLARRILEEQGGIIRVKDAVDCGSIFQITFPK